jgi:hypothetical protein
MPDLAVPIQRASSHNRSNCAQVDKRQYAILRLWKEVLWAVPVASWFKVKLKLNCVAQSHVAAAQDRLVM